MNCLLCKAGLESSMVNHIVDWEGHIIIIKNVPANVCGQCGEHYIEHDIAIKLEKIIEEAKKAGAEVTIMNYQDKAA
ncbi:MAG: type II toxin-antitoxin system MqsA family antitoxin [Syntrophomonas sp.]